MSNWKAELIKNLPDAYAKSKDSNNYKILEIEKRTNNELRDILQDVLDSLDLDNVKGKTLDLYGDLVGQPRGKATDEQYLLMIKAKIARNYSNGSYYSVKDCLAKTFGCDPSEVQIKEYDVKCIVNVTVPLQAINKVDLTAKQATAIIKSVLPVGVALESYSYEGTFEFGYDEIEQDEAKGFSDLGAYPTDQNYNDVIGGYFGATAGDETDVVFPI